MNLSLNWTESAHLGGMEVLHGFATNCSDVFLGKYWCTPMFGAIGVIMVLGFILILVIQLIPDRWLK